MVISKKVLSLTFNVIYLYIDLYLNVDILPSKNLIIQVFNSSYPLLLFVFNVLSFLYYHQNFGNYEKASCFY